MPARNDWHRDRYAPRHFHQQGINMIGQKLVALACDLVERGYTGDISFNNVYPTGISAYFQNTMDPFSLCFSGFCKETLYLTESPEGEISAYGRYSLLGKYDELTWQDVTKMAWSMYQKYKDRSYGCPPQFEGLFLHLGYLKKVTKEVIEEA